MKDDVTPIEGLERFRYRTLFEVRFSDLDLNEHLNNGALVQYLAMARMTYCEDVGLGKLSRLGLMLVSTTVEYRAQARFRDVLTCGVRISRLGRSSMTFDQALWLGAQHLIADARSVVVHTEDGASATPIPQVWRSSICEWEPIAPTHAV